MANKKEKREVFIALEFEKFGDNKLLYSNPQVIISDGKKYTIACGSGRGTECDRVFEMDEKNLLDKLSSTDEDLDVSLSEVASSTPNPFKKKNGIFDGRSYVILPESVLGYVCGKLFSKEDVLHSPVNYYKDYFLIADIIGNSIKKCVNQGKIFSDFHINFKGSQVTSNLSEVNLPASRKVGLLTKLYPFLQRTELKRKISSEFEDEYTKRKAKDKLGKIDADFDLISDLTQKTIDACMINKDVFIRYANQIDDNISQKNFIQHNIDSYSHSSVDAVQDEESNVKQSKEEKTKNLLKEIDQLFGGITDEQVYGSCYGLNNNTHVTGEEVLDIYSDLEKEGRSR